MMRGNVTIHNAKSRCFLKGLKQFLLLSFLILIMSGVADSAAMPDDDQIKADLVGRHIVSGHLKWRFDSPSEFHKFKIKSKKINGLFLEYKISVILKPASGPMGAADLIVVYKKENSRWRFVTVTDNKTLRITESSIAEL